LVGLPGLLNRVADSYLPILSELDFDRLAALPYAGLPIATALSLSGGFPLVYPRKETKAYGTQAEIEGIFSAGEQAVLIDDLATTGGSKFEAITKLNSVGLQVTDVVVLIDRQSGAVEDLASAGFQLHAIFTLTQLLDYWKTAELISEGQVDEVQNFIAFTRVHPDS
jgi:uridine monophosphate synthetase